MIRIYPSRRAGGPRNPALRDSEKRGWKSEGFLKTWVPRYFKKGITKKN